MSEFGDLFREMKKQRPPDTIFRIAIPTLDVRGDGVAPMFEFMDASSYRHRVWKTWLWMKQQENAMRKKEVCGKCGKQIDKARQALDLPVCESCAKEMPGNILRTLDPPTAILDATMAALPQDKGNAAPTKSIDNRTVK